MAPSPPRPRIAITCDHEVVQDSRGCPSPRFWLNEAYVRAVDDAQGEPYVLPFVPNITPARAQALLAPMDGLLVSGGAFDVDPALYGQAKHPACGRLEPTRTHFEASLLRAALARDMPILGICGGMQLMVALGGGSLYQDLSLRPGTGVHEQPFDKRLPSHPIAITPGSILHQLVGQEVIRVNSTHHQVIDHLGSYQVSATSEDGVIEAIEGHGPTFRLGVQWHPELLQDQAGLDIYTGFVRAC